MPLYGTLDITQDAKRLPTLPNLDTEAWALPKAEMMQLLIEVPRSSTEGLLPKAMHPALPSYVILAVTRYRESPVGPFNLAVLRLGSRAGAHPRGFLLGAVASTEAAAKELRGRWGFPVEAGEVKFVRRHDRVMGTVKKDGKTILDCALVDPQPVSGTDVQYINWVTAANAPLDGKTAADADPGRSEIHLLQGRARQAAGQRLRRGGVERGDDRACRRRSSAPAARSTPTCRASAS